MSAYEVPPGLPRLRCPAVETSSPETLPWELSFTSTPTPVQGPLRGTDPQRPLVGSGTTQTRPGTPCRPNTPVRVLRRGSAVSQTPMTVQTSRVGDPCCDGPVWDVPGLGHSITHTWEDTYTHTLGWSQVVATVLDDGRHTVRGPKDTSGHTHVHGRDPGTLGVQRPRDAGTTMDTTGPSGWECSGRSRDGDGTGGSSRLIGRDNTEITGGHATSSWGRPSGEGGPGRPGASPTTCGIPCDSESGN